MQTAALNSELTADPRIGKKPANPAVRFVITPLGKPYPKTDPPLLDLTPQLIDHPAFAVVADDIQDPPLVAPQLAAATTGDALPDLPELDPLSPEIAPFLLSALQQRATEDEPSLKDVGRDFNDLPCEVALLSACIAEPEKTLAKIVDDAHTEIFYDGRHRAIFLAVLELVQEGRAVNAAAVLSCLKDTEADFGSDYVDYIHQVCGVRYCWDHLPFYMTRLRRAARRRGGEAYCQFGFSESFSAYMLLQRMPHVKCVGADIHVYLTGAWNKTDRHLLRPHAAACIHPRQRTAKHAMFVLDYVETVRQVHKDTFHGAYKWADERIVINVNNGTLEVAVDGQVRFREHSKDDYFTLKLAADYDADAVCDTFEATLLDALPDQEDRDVLQAFAGYILFPGCDYEVSLVCYGPGGTGKSTILNGIGSVLGSSLCGKASLEELCKTSGYSLPTIATKLLNLGTELNGTEIEESANFKKLVSGEGMLARQIYCEPGEMVTTCKLAFLTNNVPRFKYGTDAETRRLRILHFDRKPEAKDTSLKARISAEASGILNWALAGLAHLLREGEIPQGGATAKDALKAFARGNDPIGSFVEERCVFHPDACVTKHELFGAFDSWCKQHGFASGEKMENFFWKTLRQRHSLRDTKVAPAKGAKRENCLSGIALLPDPDLD